MAATMGAMTLLSAFTGLLALLVTLRLARLVIADDIGLWYIRGPAALWAINHDTPTLGWRSRLVSGLNCPFCVGFWIGALVLLSLALVGGPDSTSTAADVWRWVAAPFALNYLAAHVGVRLGDTDTLDDDD